MFIKSPLTCCSICQSYTYDIYELIGKCSNVSMRGPDQDTFYVEPDFGCSNFSLSKQANPCIIKMMNEVREAYICVRKNNQSIPDETLDFMLFTSLEALKEML